MKLFNKLVQVCEWARSPKGSSAIVIKCLLTGTVLSVFVNPTFGQALGAFGTVFWIWVRIES